jgi:hypothetical protein
MKACIAVVLLVMGCSGKPSYPKKVLDAVAGKAEAIVQESPAHKYKVGDCILSLSHHEDWEPNPPRKIEKVGNESYYAPSADDTQSYTFETFPFALVDRPNEYVKVKCP